MTNLSLSINEETGLAVLTFDRPNSSANIFDEKTLDELDIALSEIEADIEIKKLVITSGKPGIFIAGADIKSISKATPEQLEAFLVRGQELFGRIAELPIPTAAAIHGACLGGGLELALACDVRVASFDRATKIGLPETLLGIVPAWGGSTRLPKLIGIQKALPLILSGKKMAPKHAKKVGVVDDLAPRERLVRRCEQLLDRPPKRKKYIWQNSILMSGLAGKIAKRDILKKTRGHYPALLKAIQVAVGSCRRSETNSLKAERDAALELAETESTRQLIRLFFLTEKSKKAGVECQKEVPVINHCTVIGAGVMGAGIAHWTASRGIPVLLKDLNEEAVAKGMKTIANRFAEAVERRIFTKNEAAKHFNLVAPTAENVPIGHTDLAIEAAVENMEIKKKIFEDLSDRTQEEAILATNTSALSIKELADTALQPSRVVGLHFFNPVHRMKLVEIIHTDDTAPEVVQACLDFVRKIGKSPVLVKDSPGFLVNRILMPYLIEAGRLLQEGVNPKQIDEAMLDFGMPVGPIQLLDDIGLDVALHVAQTMEDSFQDRMKTPDILKRLVDEGILGRKSGRGIYLYTKGSKGKINPAAVSHISDKTEMSKEEIADRLSLLMVAESHRCLEEGIVKSADDIDFAMIMGTGWAPFRGGPMAYSASLGAQAKQKMQRFYGKNGDIYEIPISMG